MSAKSKYEEIAVQLNKDIEKAVEQACDKVHGDIIPFINDDTEYNAVYRAINIVQDILRGNFEVKGNSIKVNGWTIHSLTSNHYDELVDILSVKMSDKAKDLKIARLEHQIEELNNF